MGAMTSLLLCKLVEAVIVIMHVAKQSGHERYTTVYPGKHMFRPYKSIDPESLGPILHKIVLSLPNSPFSAQVFY